jgi:NAD(P)-dependent dehydrogenase (short-subunit alcohol dehydrogenase family)
LRQDASYLISGGLKGLCGSLAIYLARNGATNIVTIARSGYGDAASQSVIYNLKAMNCQVDLIVGDVTNIEDVRQAFKQARKPVAGVIQGAMTLRVSILELPLQPSLSSLGDVSNNNKYTS